jgi:hypothetical protein
MSEPRQFWIADTDRYQCMSCGSLICGEDPSESKCYEGNTLHVVEYSALEQANIALARIFSDAARLTEERDKLEAENARLRAALEQIASDNLFLTPQIDWQKIAEEALK